LRHGQAAMEYAPGRGHQCAADVPAGWPAIRDRRGRRYALVVCDVLRRGVVGLINRPTGFSQLNQKKIKDSWPVNFPLDMPNLVTRLNRLKIKEIFPSRYNDWPVKGQPFWAAAGFGHNAARFPGPDICGNCGAGCYPARRLVNRRLVDLSTRIA